MSTYVSKEVSDGIEAARIAALRKSSRLRVTAGDDVFQILRMWGTGFSVEASVAPSLRGFVDLYDGTNHLYQCLIVASDEEGGEMRYEFKRSTVATDRAALDYYREPGAPVALLL